MDLWNKLVEFVGVGGGLKKVIDHWRYTAVVLLGGLTISGCAFLQPKVMGRDGVTKLTRADVDREVGYFKVWVDNAYKSLDEQENQIRTILAGIEQVSSQVAPGYGWAVGLGLSFLSGSLLGVGATKGDGLRKDRVIEGLKADK